MEILVGNMATRDTDKASNAELSASKVKVVVVKAILRRVVERRQVRKTRA